MKCFSTYFILFLFFVCNKMHAQQKPNVIIIVADDLGWNDVGYHNGAMITPNINSLAAQGVELNRFYVGALCSPTRAGIMTGKYPDRFGLRTVVGPRAIGGLPLEEETIANIFERAGYNSRAAFGKWHLGHSDIKYHPLNRGFNYYYGHYNGAIDYYTHFRDGTMDWQQNFALNIDSGYSVDLITKKTLDFIRSSSRQPFFAYVAYNAPHTPLQAKPEYLKLYGFDSTKKMEDYDGGGYQASEFNLAEYGKTGRGNTARQTYCAMVTALDGGVGKILQTVRDLGIEKNTIIWFVSDNGGDLDFGASNLPLRGEKQTEWEGGVRVPAIVYWKGKWQGGGKCNEVMGYIDMLPTLANIISVKPKTDVDGINVGDAFIGKRLPDRYFFLGHEAVVKNNWKLNKNELFNLSEDISETTDVSNRFPEIYKNMLNAYAGFKSIVRPLQLKYHPVEWRPASWDIMQANEDKK